ncbi:cystatin-F [Suncus etruscus]|uniref:cystatin-F n=1 Tax=Suncus etruscus TaxID=109475 RepID=UPI00210FEEC6|nr:cystatin-F [Suncus etruscus]
MLRSCQVLACCCLILGTLGVRIDTCQQLQDSSIKPGFPKPVKTNDPDVLKAARFSVEMFNNCSNDIFLFKESRIKRALVQIVNGLKYMLDMDIGRTTCKKNHPQNLENCNFPKNRMFEQTFSCYTEVWVVPWLHKSEVLALHCQQLPPGLAMVPWLVHDRDYLGQGAELAVEHFERFAEK